ncbi:MAG: 50S ribosomal protein L18 [Spirochaetaceae bacterium]|nr:MAG: 50S ribosomal protein L18 [Spirochaetaceae bacterium]
MKKQLDKIRKRNRRKMSIRKRLICSAERPRVSIFKSNRYTYVQAIDDVAGKTLVAVSNLEKDLREIKNKVETIGKLGEVMGERLKGKNIQAIAFDRNGYPYHGIVKAVADGIRKAGIDF